MGFKKQPFGPYLCYVDFRYSSKRIFRGLQGVYDTVQASRQNREVVVLGSQRFGTGDYSSPDWYIEQAYRNQRLRRDAGFGPQVDVGQVM